MPRGKFLMTSLHVICGLGSPIETSGYAYKREIVWKTFLKTFFLENTCGCVLGSWPWPRAFLSLASRESVLGKAVLGLGLGLGFFCVLGLGLELCVLDSTSAKKYAKLPVFSAFEADFCFKNENSPSQWDWRAEIVKELLLFGPEKLSCSFLDLI